ncbi:MAG TPA: hypothetical protein VK508_04705 [Cyclobacteriaceae bacterium]|nr:hypothetical protein [Cyclobacteriaceae bacterium]
MDDEELQKLEDRIKHSWNEIVKMEERVNALPEQVNSFSDQVDELRKQLVTHTEQLSKINEHYKDYFATDDFISSSKFETVNGHYKTSEQFLKSATEARDQLNEFKDFIYGNENLKTVGFKKDLETLFEKNRKSNEDLEKDWGGKYSTLYDKIEGLLPGATATGLSKAYGDQKLNYKWPVIMWSIVFGSTVGGMMIFGWYFYSDVKDLQDSLKHILARLPFFIPAVWLAIFASRQQSQYKRLQQEYVYKETLAKSYEAYKREIDKLMESDVKVQLQEKLIAAMVEMCGYNPSLTLEHKSHDEKPPIPGSDLLMNFGLGKSKPAGVKPE